MVEIIMFKSMSASFGREKAKEKRIMSRKSKEFTKVNKVVGISRSMSVLIGSNIMFKSVSASFV